MLKGRVIKMDEKMTNEPMTKLIIKMSLPAIFSMLISALYNIVDSVFVSRLGPFATTAISLVFPIQMLIIAISVGTGVGVNSIISRRLGEQNRKEASLAASHGISLGAISSFAFVLFGLFVTKWFFTLFTKDQLVYDVAIQYNYVITIFSFGIIMQIMIEKILQATGNMIYPMLFGLLGAVINLVLDPILIFGYFGFPAMGVLGAGIATVIGQITAMFAAFFVLLQKEHGIKIKLIGLKLKKRIVLDIYIVGFPAIIMQSIASFLIMALNNMLNIYEPIAIPILGIYFKLQSFIFMPIFGLTQGVMPVMGYNFGAKNKKRLVEALKSAILIGSIIMIAGTILFSVFPAQLIGFFKPSDKMLELGIVAFRNISIGFVFAAVGIMFSILFQASGLGNLSLLISVFRQIIIILPCAYIFIRFLGISYFWLAFPISDLISAVISFVFYKTIYQNKIADFT